LVRKGFEPDVAEQVLGRLQKAGLVDDTDFAEVWVRSRHTHRGLGRRALESELLRKGVAKKIAEEAVRGIDGAAEEDRARTLVRRRLPALIRIDKTTAMRRLVDMLARKGYPGGLAYRVVREELGTARAPTLGTESDGSMSSMLSYPRGATDPKRTATDDAQHSGRPCFGGAIRW
jgi:regulatory protein